MFKTSIYYETIFSLNTRYNKIRKKRWDKWFNIWFVKCSRLLFIMKQYFYWTLITTKYEIRWWDKWFNIWFVKCSRLLFIMKPLQFLYPLTLYVFDALYSLCCRITVLLFFVCFKILLFLYTCTLVYLFLLVYNNMLM